MNQNKVLRLPEVIERTGLSRSTIYAHIKEDKFPAFFKLGARAIGWNSEDIDCWIEQRIEESRNTEVAA